GTPGTTGWFPVGNIAPVPLSKWRTNAPVTQSLSLISKSSSAVPNCRFSLVGPLKSFVREAIPSTTPLRERKLLIFGPDLLSVSPIICRVAFSCAAQAISRSFTRPESERRSPVSVKFGAGNTTTDVSAGAAGLVAVATGVLAVAATDVIAAGAAAGRSRGRAGAARFLATVRSTAPTTVA